MNCRVELAKRNINANSKRKKETDAETTKCNRKHAKSTTNDYKSNKVVSEPNESLRTLKKTNISK